MRSGTGEIAAVSWWTAAMPDEMKARNFAKVLRRLREIGRNQAWLARELGAKDKRITNWKDGIGEPSGSQLWRIAGLIGLPIEYLADPEMMEPPPPPITAYEREVLTLMRALGLSRDEALRRLSRLPVPDNHGDGTPIKASRPKPPKTAPRRRKSKGNADR